ncbi:MAG: PD-(D/E)XK nuclease family protein [Pseudomonadota bacterium]
MGDLVNTFSWSHSRRGCFEACLRQYWLTYYGSWGGWERDAPTEVREAYIQKKLTSRAMWIGTVVHDLAEGALKDLMRGRAPDPAWHRRRALERARRDIRESEGGRWREWPSKVCAFQEHYYGVEVPAAAWEEALGVIERQVEGFFSDPVVLRLGQVPERLVEVEKLAQVQIEGVPVWVKLDALVSDGRGGMVVIDWKTGVSHQEEVIVAQLGVYGLYCTLVHSVPADRILAMHVNLRLGLRSQHPVDAAVLDETRRQVRVSADAMRACLVDPEANIALERDFPPLPEGDAACAGCAFRRSCGRG